MTNSIHPAALPADKLLAACQVTRTRRSGPGGQHRNKVETAVVIEHTPTGLVAEAGERRSQNENRTVAIFRLRLKLAVEVRFECAAPFQPSPLWRSRCRGGKISVSSEHDNFPAILAEALDVSASCGHDLKAAAAILECTPSQLTKLLQQEPRAMAVVNDAREKQGLYRLK
ncbi:MAG: peptide chain release factor-like protein [Planctomycetia bacterium]|nr:peptide chain release factor-like protein [Planctomycetia bacterium]